MFAGARWQAQHRPMGPIQQDTDASMASEVSQRRGTVQEGCAAHGPTEGALDESFGIEGMVTTDFDSQSDSINDLILQSDGKLLAVGSALVGYAGLERYVRVALARYHIDGTLDESFGVGGRVTTDLGTRAYGHAAAMQPDGKLVVAGQASMPGPYGAINVFMLARYHPDGSIDESFGEGGIVRTSFDDDDRGTNATAWAVVVQPDEKIVAAGVAAMGTYGGSDNFALARYYPDGSPDPSFGVNGRVTTDFVGERDRAYALVLQPDGKLVAAGLARERLSGGDNYGLARYNSDGSLDESFGAGGHVMTDIFGVADVPRALVLQPDGKLVAAGNAKIDGGAHGHFALARYNPDGSLDESFGLGGIATTEIPGPNGTANALVLQPDGKFVAAGTTGSLYTNEAGSFILTRYHSDGSLDTSFGVNGCYTTDFAGDINVANAVVVQGDGKVVAAGFARMGALSNTEDFALVRYMPTDIGTDTEGYVRERIQPVIEQNYPNPFHAQTHISFQLAEPAVVRIAVLDLLGREVVVLHNAPVTGGVHTVSWDGRDSSGRRVASGAYYVQLRTESFMKTRPMTLVNP
jgi:uncharacterized delta-60 repeat protein